MCHDKSDPGFPGHASITETFLSIDTLDGPLQASLFMPQGAPRGCVLVASDMFGRSPFYRMLGKRLAAEGYVALVPELFSRLWPVADGDDKAGIARIMAFDRRVAMRDLQAMIAHIRLQHPERGLAVMGFCIGGALAVSLASRAAFEATVLFYATLSPRPATELSPFVPLDDLAGCGTPLLAFWGDSDEFVPAEVIDAARDGIARSGQPHDIVVLPGQGHAFLTFDPAEPEYAASQQSWRQTLGFLDTHLGARENPLQPRVAR
ncbi:dienelactone hydrolase family protein [Frigidibacter mobilis]|uniref:Carboxymethylenebutenolidase n=1 Tax=Frigidibacter mobilis TaxID=1335048 RepID=A0A159Z6Q8_9RHOB|nr:dienelactone hydrolase family protein [Frigidibacter mobilis]AMY71046.1 carboxymethylenebutenolidase [Frigidibacter mobilis]